MSEEKNNASSEWKKREIGALWRREGKNQKYLSGKVTLGEFGEEQTIQVVIYSNKFKEKDNQPDFRIYKSEPAAQSAQPSDSVVPASPAKASESVDSDIPDVLQ
tara:strand:- start:16596 stop:16907 length:312 start_codon:yes stop_codon:yes gene_type:complete